MKFTNYFLHTRQRPDRKVIKIEWIERICKNPQFIQEQKDVRIRKWGYIKETEKYLRVCCVQQKKKTLLTKALTSFLVARPEQHNMLIT